MMRVWAADVYFRDRLTGKAECKFDDASYFRPASTHMFCCECGTIWGKLLFPLSQKHHVTNVPCERHGGGVFDHQWQGRLTCTFSYEVSVHDFCTMFEWLDKGKLPMEMQDSGSMERAVVVGLHKKSLRL